VAVKLPGCIENVEIVKKEKVGKPEESSYLSLYSLRVVNTYTDGTKSEPYRYEAVLRKWLDAVVLILSAKIDGMDCVCLRTSIRPPLLLRPMIDLPQPDDERYFAVLEVPAGLIEDSDKGEEGLLRRAAAETFEETGYQLSPDDFVPLGCGLFVTPGVIPEKMIFLTAKIADIGLRMVPKGDGSPSEEGSDIRWVGVDKALEMCNKGEIVDMKTELGIRRLAAFLSSDKI
jgi:ADP-ribose pyrophosphatase